MREAARRERRSTIREVKGVEAQRGVNRSRIGKEEKEKRESFLHPRPHLSSRPSRDSGVKAILKDIHNKIRTLEAELTEMHRKMAAEPEAGISVLMDRSERGKRISSEDDAKAWFDLIGKHKE